jgi:hypothetical protein
MYVNRKMRPTETIPGMVLGGGEIKKNHGVGEFKYDTSDVLSELL